MQPTIIDATRNAVPNPERETQGVRRFIEGMRDEKGRIDEDFKRHLEYHLQDETEMTWENAIKVASRYESAADASEAEDGSSDDDSGEADADKNKKSGGGKVTISALSDQDYENQERISAIESALERMAAAQETTNAMLQEMMTKLDLCLPAAQGGFYDY